MEGVFVHESSYVDDNCLIGKGTKIWHFSHIMSGCQIGEDCQILVPFPIKQLSST